MKFKCSNFITFSLALTALFLSGCGVPQQASISSAPDLSGYKYVYVAPTSDRMSGIGVVSGGSHGVFGMETTTAVNPSEIIAGNFMKRGFIMVTELSDDRKAQTVVVNCAESGRKSYGLGYSIEMTVQLLDAATDNLICSATAEGMGETEADDVRIAVNKCLNAIFRE